MVRWTSLVMQPPSTTGVPEIGHQVPGPSETGLARSQVRWACLMYCLVLLGAGGGISWLAWRVTGPEPLHRVVPVLGFYLGGGTALVGLLYGLKGLGWPLEPHLTGPTARRGIQVVTRLVLGPFFLVSSGLLIVPPT